MKENMIAPVCRDIRHRSGTIFQVALMQSLAQGYFDGIISVGELRRHGDTGIGTFEGVNGEMIVLDGTVYQAVSDGSIVIPSDEEMVPFSNVTWFEEDVSVSLSQAPDMPALQEQLNKIVREQGANLFYMVKITGNFAFVKFRSEYKQEKPYRELDTALAADQVEFDAGHIRGTMVGLCCPDYMRGLNSAGWHFHFITEDRSRGGHVLQVSVEEAAASFSIADGFEMVLPKRKDFQSMDLSRNMDAQIYRAETAINGA